MTDEMTVADAVHVLRLWHDHDEDLPIPSNGFGAKLVEALNVIEKAIPDPIGLMGQPQHCAVCGVHRG